VALILLDRVKVNTTTTGTGTVVLASTAPAGYQSFAVIGDNNTTYYTIAGQTTSEWEVGIGTYYLANSSLSRTTILSSSAANAAVTFSAGTKDVFVTYPAERAIYADSSNITTITNFASANVLITGGKVNSVAHTGGSIDNMTIGATTANTGAFTNITATTINSTSTTLLATSSGNVGVGTIAPLDKLSVSTSTAGGVGGVISIVNGATATVGNEADLGFRNASQFATTYYSGKIRSVMTNATTFVSDMAFNTYDASGPNGIEAMRLTSSGNLVVDTNTLFVDATNNRVGVGTASPAYPLDVQAASNTTLIARIYNANTNSATQSALVLNAGGRSANFYVNYAGSYFFHQGSSLTASYTDYDTQSFRNNAGVEQFRIANTASANNYVQVTGGLGVGPTISAAGTDTNIDIKLTPKGTGYANITSGGVKLGNSTIQDSSGNLVFTTGGANVTAFTLDQNKLSTFAASIKETANVSTANATANVTLNAITQSVLYYTGNATANTTINITGNSTVTLNNAMANGQSISVVFMSTQGATAYYVNGYQIDGVAVTPKWQGGTAPTAGNTLGIDVYSFTAVKTASATYTVLASQTQFK